MEHEMMLEIAQSGILAPSADNNHAFRLEFKDSAILLWHYESPDGDVKMHRRVMQLISFGAVVENMQLRAQELGFDAVCDWFPNKDEKLIARICLHPAKSLQSDPLAKSIPFRHTNRRMYQRSLIANDEKQTLQRDLEQISGAKLIWLSGVQRRQALRMIWLAESERFLRKGLHKELFSSIRFDLNWHDSATQALSPGALEIEKPMRLAFKSLQHWPLMRALHLTGAHRLLGLRAGLLPCLQASALGVVATDLPLPEGAIAVGRGFERLWLRATLLELALQPMAASTVLPLQEPDVHGASDKVRATLSSGWSRIVPTGMVPLMVFRVGRARAASTRSGRMHISHYMLDSKHDGDKAE